jgi:hypothetical protein
MKLWKEEGIGRMELGAFQIIRASLSTCIAAVLVKGSSAHGMIP